MTHEGQGSRARTRGTESAVDQDQVWWTRLLFWSLCACFIYIAANLFRLHLFPDSRLESAESLRVATSTTKPPRGKIRDAKGHILAHDRQVPSLYADPSRIESPYETALRLSAELNMAEDLVVDRLTRRKRDGSMMEAVPIKRWLSDSEASVLNNTASFASSGLYFREEPERRYPEGQLAAHVLGFVNREGVGSAGIEARFERYLQSEEGYRTARVDRNRRLLDSLTKDQSEGEAGADVWLTLQTPLQDALERELAAVMERTQAERASGIVMDPHTGAILALASIPTFDPNDYRKSSPESMKNNAAIDVFEPGSTFKIVPFAAALEHGLITPNTLIDCENGSFNPYGHRIRDLKKMGVVSASEAFAQSSNIGTIKIAAMLGQEEMSLWIQRFGFGKTATGLFPGESAGIFRSNTKDWSRLSMGALPIGQEVAVTTLQLARSFCVLANGGFLIRPYIVDRIVRPDGTFAFRHDPSAERTRVLSDATAATMRELCHLVVTDGTGHHANIPQFRVCGKTGTGQVAKAEGGGYEEEKVTTVFAGFAPLRSPRVCSVIVVHDPKPPKSYGGNVCGPVFQAVVREALILQSCPEDPVVREVAAQGSAAKSEDDVDTVAHALPPRDPMVAFYEAELMRLAKDDLYGDALLPDFMGMTRRQARDRLSELEIEWKGEGSGRVVHQVPAPGTPLHQVAECRLLFRTPIFADGDDASETESVAGM